MKRWLIIGFSIPTMDCDCRREHVFGRRPRTLHTLTQAEVDQALGTGLFTQADLDPLI